jgi:hypothetical protein
MPAIREVVLPSNHQLSGLPNTSLNDDDSLFEYDNLNEADKACCQIKSVSHGSVIRFIRQALHCDPPLLLWRPFVLAFH